MVQIQVSRTPQFPENLDEYAPWVAKHGLYAPYGECQCGCGEAAPIAPWSDASKGYRKGHPRRFKLGHVNFKPIPPIQPKYCECGCGAFTKIANGTDSSRGYVKGQPRRFLPGHEIRVRHRRARRQATRWIAEEIGHRKPIYHE